MAPNGHGLWEFAKIGDKDILSATIIVGAPNPLAAAIHDRMPVILEPEDYDRWLDSATSVDDLRRLLRPYPAEKMTAQAVSRLVNSVKNDTEETYRGATEPQDEIPLPMTRHRAVGCFRRTLADHDLRREEGFAATTNIRNIRQFASLSCMQSPNPSVTDRLYAAESIVTLLAKLDVSKFPWEERLAVGVCQAKAANEWISAYCLQKTARRLNLLRAKAFRLPQSSGAAIKQPLSSYLVDRTNPSRQ